MPFRVTCPSCRSVAACPDDYRGKSLRCKKCGRNFIAGAPAPRKAAAPPRRSSGARFLVVALVAVLIGAGVGVPAAYLLLKKDKLPDDLAAGQPTTAPADTGRAASPVSPAPATAKQEPPPPAPVAWQDFTSREGSFSARFPGLPQVSSSPDSGGRRTRTVTVSLPARRGGKPASFAITSTEYDPDETADPAFLAAVTADRARAAREKKALTLGGFPGIELRGEETDAEGTVWLTAQRLYAVRGRLHDLVASAAPGPDSEALFKQFFDSFALLDSGPAEPVVKPPPVTVPAVTEPVVKPRRVELANLQLTPPEGWKADYNKFLSAWLVTKPPPTPRSEAEMLRIEQCPEDARTPAAYAAHLKEKDFLNVDMPAWVEIGDKEDLPDGFVIKGVVKKYGNPKTPPVLGLVAVRDLGGLKVRCFSSNLRTDKGRDELLRMFAGAK